MLTDQKADDMELVEPSKLDWEKRLVAAALVIESLPEFYEALSRYLPKIQEHVSMAFGRMGGETEITRVAINSQGIVSGVFSALPARRLKQAQLTDLREYIKGIKHQDRLELRNKLMDIGAETNNLSPDSWYLARFAVAQKFRSSGLSNMLLSRFMEYTQEFDTYSLHVKADNHRAVAFYRRNNFVPVADQGNSRYLVMERKSDN